MCVFERESYIGWYIVRERERERMYVCVCIRGVALEVEWGQRGC